MCVYGDNISPETPLSELTHQISAIRPDALIALDEEGGDVTRLFFTTGAPYPGNALLGRLNDLALTEQVGCSIGLEMRQAGCNLALAPVADVNTNPLNPVIGVRSFGASPDLVARHVAAWIRGAHSGGVAVCAKHFPGHGDTAVDSHRGLPVVDRSVEELDATELVPFRAALDAGTDSVMTSHILLPQIDPTAPATMSADVLDGLLRRRLGHHGAIITDALDMRGASGEIGIPEAAVRALVAGADLLCLGPDNTAELVAETCQAITDAVASGRLPQARLDAAATHSAGLRSPTHVPATSDLPLHLSPATLLPGFEVSEDARSWIERAHGDFDLVRVDTSVNPAVNTVPWGPFAAGARPVGVLSPSDHPTLDTGRFIAVVGRGLHRHLFAREFLDDLRAAAPERVIAVEMGWPGDRRYAQIATFSGTRLAGQALIDLLRGTR